MHRLPVSLAVSTMRRLMRPPAACWARHGYFWTQPREPAPGDRVLVVSCNWVGDNFWACQVMPTLRSRFPHTHWWVLTKPHSRDLWQPLVEEGHLIVSESVTSDRRREQFRLHELLYLARDCRSRQFDAVIDLTGNRYSALMTFLCRPRWSIGSEGDELGWLYSTCVHAYRAGRHLAEKPWRVIEPILGEFAYPNRMQPAVAQCEYATFRDRLGIPKRGRVALVAPGAGWEAKRWPAESFASLAGMLAARGYVVAAVGGVGERALCERAIRGTSRGINAAGLPLSESLALMKRAAVVVSNDSAAAHLAAAFGTPTVAIFGPTNPLICGPIGPRVAIVRADCPDRPEGVQHHCRDRPGAACCRRCVAAIAPQQVMQHVDRLLANKE